MRTAKAVRTSTIEPATVVDALEFIAENLRTADRAEIRATSGLSPEDSLMASYHLSTSSYLILDRLSTPIGAMGAAPSLIEDVGIIWMLGTDGIEREALSIARQTVRYVEELHTDYPVLWNYIDARNELSMRWLDASGFSIADVLPSHGPEHRPFFQFVRHR